MTLFRCAKCGGPVHETIGVGRVMRDRRDTVIPVPDDLPIPTCSTCGTEHHSVDLAERCEGTMLAKVARAWDRCESPSDMVHFVALLHLGRWSTFMPTLACVRAVRTLYPVESFDCSTGDIEICPPHPLVTLGQWITGRELTPDEFLALQEHAGNDEPDALLVKAARLRSTSHLLPGEVGHTLAAALATAHVKVKPHVSDRWPTTIRSLVPSDRVSRRFQSLVTKGAISADRYSMLECLGWHSDGDDLVTRLDHCRSARLSFTDQLCSAVIYFEHTSVHAIGHFHGTREECQAWVKAFEKEVSP